MIRRGAGRKSVDQSRIGASAITWLERELHVHPLFLFARFTPSLSLFSYLARSIEQISIPNIANRVHHRECKERKEEIKAKKTLIRSDPSIFLIDLAANYAMINRWKFFLWEEKKSDSVILLFFSSMNGWITQGRNKKVGRKKESETRSVKHLGNDLRRGFQFPEKPHPE